MEDGFILYVCSILAYGFCFAVFFSYLISLFKSKKHQTFNTSFFSYTIKTVRIVAILYLLYYLFFMSHYFLSYDASNYIDRATGPYAWAYWMMLLQPVIFCTLIQLLWFRKLQQKNSLNFILIFLIFLIILSNGTNFERFVIIVTSWHLDYAPSGFSPKGYAFIFPVLLLIMLIERTLIFSGLVLIVRYIDLKLRNKS